MDNLAVETRLVYLAHGYMREQYTTHDDYDQLESSLVNVIIKLFGNIFMRFDIYPLKYKYMFSDCNTTFKRNADTQGTFTFGCSYGMNKGTHKISIERKTGGFDGAYGLTTDIEYFKEKSVWFNCHKKADICYLNGTTIGQLIGSGKNFVAAKTQWGTYKRGDTKSGDVMMMCLNCNEWKFKYLINDEQIGKSLNVIPDQMYYFFVSSYYNGVNIEYHVS